MNILIPHSWLLEHLDTKATPEQIQNYLSLCGPSVEGTHKVGKETVYDIEVTTNRVDAMSVRGIAREATAILPQFGIKAKLKPLQLPKVASKTHLDINIKNDPKLCHRILAIKLENIKIADSPDWLRKRLKQIGQRPLNNIIDITNYVMWELGHPVHAFDYDRLTNKTIIVRQAKSGEKITTLDDKTHTLTGGEVIFDDGTGNIVDLPGIMGTQNTVITHHTRNVLFWVESVDASKIRQASMSLSIRTQAAVLNEKGVDPQLARPALLRCIELANKVAQAKVSSQIVDIYPSPTQIKPTILNQQLIDTYLGFHLEPKRIINILTSLGCTVRFAPSSRYVITPPTFRAADLSLPQDYIEEIARIYGYHNLPAVLLTTTIPDNPSLDNFYLEHLIKTWLADWGLTEVYTYSLVSEKLAARSWVPLKNHLRLKNPLTKDLVFLRQSLIPSHTHILSQNQSRGELAIFEMANIYLPQDTKLPLQKLSLTITTTKDYSWAKGIIETLLLRLFIPQIKFSPLRKSLSPFSAHRSVTIKSGNTTLGTLGQLKTSANIYAAEVNVSTLISLSSSHPRYQSIPKTSPIIEDLTFILPPQTHLGPLIDTIKSSSEVIQSVNFKDHYQGSFTFTITYRDPKTQLTDDNVSPLRQHIVNILKKIYSAQLKGKL